MVYWKCIIWAKADFPTINSIWAKTWFTINGLPKMLFLILAFFHFSKFRLAFAKNLMELLSFFEMDFEGSYEVLLRHKYFWSAYFWQWNDCHFFFVVVVEIFTEMHFVSLSFLNKRNITTSLWWNISKCTLVHCASLNSGSKNKLYLRTVEYVVSFFSISYQGFCQKLYEKNYIFLMQISKIHLKI